MEKKKGKCREVESKILSKIGERNIKEDREGKQRKQGKGRRRGKSEGGEGREGGEGGEEMGRQERCGWEIDFTRKKGKGWRMGFRIKKMEK